MWCQGSKGGGEMNKSKIDWCDYTWNPVTGCLHGCEYCYARRMDKRFGDGLFNPTFHQKRLDEPVKVKKSAKIFVGSVSDLFGNWNWEVKLGNQTWGWKPRMEIVKEILSVVEL